MLVIVGLIIVMAGVLAGFTMAGGRIGALIHPSEFVTIGGAALGAAIMMSPKKVLIDLIKGVIQCLKGSPYGKPAYEELFKVLYDLFRLARREGLITLESHVSKPEESAVFSRYPKILHNHHVTAFICGALSPVIEGIVRPEQLPGLLAAEIRINQEEHHAAMGVLSKSADALPGFGIVAAVLGIVITMGAIDGPVEEIGEKVGAALVGTFLGILLSYGVLGPLAVRMEFIGDSETGYFRTIATSIEGFVNDQAPKVALEQARRGVCSEMRPAREELDQWFADVESNK
jgi:chemotaxis protein MotA